MDYSHDYPYTRPENTTSSHSSLRQQVESLHARIDQRDIDFFELVSQNQQQNMLILDLQRQLLEVREALERELGPDSNIGSAPDRPSFRGWPSAIQTVATTTSLQRNPSDMDSGEVQDGVEGVEASTEAFEPASGSSVLRGEAPPHEPPARNRQTLRRKTGPRRAAFPQLSSSNNGQTGNVPENTRPAWPDASLHREGPRTPIPYDSGYESLPSRASTLQPRSP